MDKIAAVSDMILQTPTPHDQYADVVIRQGSGEALSQIVGQVRAKLKERGKA